MSHLTSIQLFATPSGGAGPASEPHIADAGAAAVDHVVDWPTVAQLRRTAAQEIAEAVAERRAAGPLDSTGERLLGRSVIKVVVRQHADSLARQGRPLWSLAEERSHVRAVEAAIYGYGRLQPLFEIPDAENIELCGSDSVVVQYGDGTRRTHPPVADTDEELVESIRFLGESATPTRPFDPAHPTMTLALGDRFRLHAIGFGLAHRPSVTIRQHTLTQVRLHDLVESGMMPLDLAQFLHAAVLARKSIMISGDQGAGKTTLLRALIAAIPTNERFGTLETDYELLTHLQPGRSNILALQARVGMGEEHLGARIGEVTVADLFPEALRQNLSRLIVGEVRGAEAGALFEALQSGAGTMATTHSHSAGSTIDRLAARVAQGGMWSIAEAYRQIAHHIHLLVHVRLDDQTWCGGTRRRVIGQVSQLTGAMEGGWPSTHLMYQAAGPQSAELFHPDPTMASELEPFRSAWYEQEES
ncbi:CpaF family protein [Parenemella sanctibonifatiensis]|uniref:CpaF family protein n=1 Tax=Parenemella sanctibonifatiensis TaxID=2016505 RepID=UPI0011871805|nr:CpaF/VirB11 family protein [Parenemella sanctibonifatiensis]